MRNEQAFDLYIAAMPKQELQTALKALVLLCCEQGLDGLDDMMQQLHPSEAETALLFLKQHLEVTRRFCNRIPDCTPLGLALIERTCEDCE